MKKLCLFLAGAITTITCTACGGPSSPPPSVSPSVSQPASSEDNRPVEIRVVTSYGGDDGNRQNYEKAYMAYEASTGNIINDDSAVSNEEWKNSVMSDFSSGNEPDVLFFFTGVDSNSLISENKVVSVEEIRSLYPDYASNMKDEMLVKSPVDGNIYAIPVNGYWEGLYVNKKVLADCGVSVPDQNTTWEQFLDDCQKIADKGYVPIAASLNEVPHYWFEFCILNRGNVENHSELPAPSGEEAGSANEKWVNGLNDLKELYTRGFFPENTTTALSAETDFLMIDNKAAFMIDGSWKVGWFAENAADINNFTVTYVPGMGERKPTDIIGGISMGYFISKKAWDNPEKQAACVEFVKAMTTDEVVATFGSTAVTALKNTPVPPSDVNSLTKDAVEMFNNYTGIAAAVGDSLLPNSRSDLFSNIKNIVTGETTAEEAIDRCLSILD